MNGRKTARGVLWVSMSAFVLGLILIYAFFSGPTKNPVISGYTVEQWLFEFSEADFQRQNEIKQLLITEHESAVPALVYQVERKPSALHLVAVRLWNRFSNGKRAEPNHDQRRAVAARLLGAGGAGSAPAVPALMEAATEENWSVSEPARTALLRLSTVAAPVMAARLGDSREISKQLKWIEILRGMGDEASGATPLLVSAVARTDNDQIAAKIIKIFEQPAFHDLPVTRVLVDVAEHGNPQARQAALLALGHYEVITEPIRIAIDSCLVGEEFGVRFCAAISRSRLGERPSEVVPVLIEGLGVPEFRVQAVSALGDLGSVAEPAIDELLATLIRERSPRPLRTPPSAGVALSRIGDGSIPGLVNILDHHDPRARLNSVVALGVFGRRANGTGAALVPLLKDTDETVRQATALTLSNIGFHTVEAVPVLSLMAEDDDPFVATWAGEALAEIKSTSTPQGGGASGSAAAQ